MTVHILRVEPHSEEEKCFVDKLMPITKDKVTVRLGKIFGFPWNEYEITHDDYIRIVEHVVYKDQG